MQLHRLIKASTIRNVSLALTGTCLLIIGCRKDPQITDDGKIAATSVSFNVPQGWPAPYYKFDGNTLTQAGFELGRKLFFDPRLSRDNTISCGSCQIGRAHV